MSEVLNAVVDPILARYRAVVSRAGEEANTLLSKSSLYHRLKEGKQPLIIRPPLGNSYPWHEVVERDEHHELFEAPHEWDVDWSARKGVLIRQDVWTVLSGLGTQELTVTYPGWQDLGFVWRVWSCTIPAEEANAYLVCWHRKDVQRLSTPELVKAECDARAEKWARWLDLASSLSADQMLDLYFHENVSSGYTMHSRLHRAAGRQEIEKNIAALQVRRAEGKPDCPTAQEILKHSQRKQKQLLGDSWKIIDGKLMLHTWMMQRVSPAKIGPEHYMLDV